MLAPSSARHGSASVHSPAVADVVLGQPAQQVQSFQRELDRRGGQAHGRGALRPGRGLQPVQDRYQECIGCYICVEVCALLTDYDAVRMFSTDFVEELLGVKIEDKIPDQYIAAKPYEEFFTESGSMSVRHLGKGSRIRDKINAEERKFLDWEKAKK